MGALGEFDEDYDVFDYWLDVDTLALRDAARSLHHALTVLVDGWTTINQDMGPLFSEARKILNQLEKVVQ